MSYEGNPPLRPPCGASRAQAPPSAGSKAMAGGHTAVVTLQGGLPTYTYTLPRAKESARLARRLVTTLLSMWGLPGLVDDATLVLDELVANSADHARGSSIQVTITRKDHALVRLAVVDMERKHPRFVVAGPDDEGGRGLRLVAGISQRWGVDTLHGAKRVWADVVVAP
jgi:anti-sigma regulatory factor (Ser/Thr protein kinase)